MKPVLRTIHVSKGRILCAVCFETCDIKNKKRHRVHEVNSNENFMKIAKSWTRYDHVNASVFQKHDPTSTKKLYYHHKCTKFFDERTQSRQQEKIQQSEPCMEVESGFQESTSSMCASKRNTRSSDSSCSSY